MSETQPSRIDVLFVAAGITQPTAPDTLYLHHRGRTIQPQWDNRADAIEAITLLMVDLSSLLGELLHHPGPGPGPEPGPQPEGGGDGTAES